MRPASYQTITMSQGRHSSPAHGACVMELASMLAGEPFSDRPAAACPVIGSFLRAYNDRIDDRRRQDLYAYASKVVGSRGCSAVEDARAERLAAWARDLCAPTERRWWHRRRARHRPSTNEEVGARAVHTMRRPSRRTHASVLALLDELLAMGQTGTGELALSLT